MKNKLKTFIQPGYLVVGNVTLNGCISYRHSNRHDVLVTQKTEVVEWRTERTVADKAEMAAVQRRRGELFRRLAALGPYVADFGFIVPLKRGEALEQTLRDIDEAVSEYNRDARSTRLDAWFTVFPINTGDERIACTVYRKVTSLLERAAAAIDSGNIAQLRDALDDAKGLDTVLPRAQSDELMAAVNAARAAARDAVKLAKRIGVEPSGEMVAALLRKSPVSAMRAQFVELETAVETAAAAAPRLPAVDARVVE